MSGWRPAPVDWAALGLRGNPFENVAPGQRLEWVEVPPALAAAVATRPFRVEVVGDRGAGKSTLLKEYAGRHADARYLHAGAFAAAGLPRDGAVLALDEADLLDARDLAAVRGFAAAPGASVLVGAHRSLAEALGGGFQTLRLDAHPGTAWLARRVQAHRLPGVEGFDFAPVFARLVADGVSLHFARLRVLYEVAEELARGAPFDEALLARARARAASDPTVGAAALPATSRR